MKKLKVILITLLALLMIFSVSCISTGDECTAHVDADGDEKCDTCGETVEKAPCTEHKDADRNRKCDVCGEAVEPEPCDECVDANADNICDACGKELLESERTVPLVENGIAKFQIVYEKNMPSIAIHAIDDLIEDLKDVGLTVAKLEDGPVGEQEYEVLIGNVTTRGEKYQKDPHAYGHKGYAVELVGNKVVITVGSAEVVADALESFKLDFLGISDFTESVENVKVTVENNVVEIHDNYRVKQLTLFGQDASKFTIAASRDVDAEYTTALAIQELIYTKTGFWLNIVEHSAADKSIVIKLAEKTGGLGYTITMEEDRMNFVCEYYTCLERETLTFFNNKLAIAGASGIAEFNDSDNTEINVRDVFYKDFGATGNGKTDDSEAIRACHEYANLAGHNVFADYGATYYIGILKSTIYIKTNVDWRDATFILDDSIITPDSGYRGTHIFTIPSSGSLSVPGLSDWRKSVNASGGLDASTFNKIPVSFGEGSLLVISDSNHKNYIRYGVNENSGTSQKEIILVDKDGNVDPTTPLMFDYENITSITPYIIDDEPLLIQGGTFKTSPFFTNTPQQYSSYGRGLKCSRSNVTFKNIRHYLENEGVYDYNKNTGDYGCPYGGFYVTALCNNIRYENCVASAHIVYKGSNGAGMGTYDVDPGQSTNVVYKNCYQEDGNFFATDAGGQQRWGIMGSSYCKNVTFEDTKFTRFDAHNGIYNAYLIRSTLKSLRIDGCGTFYMEGCTVYSNTFVGFREDYGGFWHGNIILKDNTIITSNATVNLFTNTWYNHYFGYPAAFPTNIIIDNLQVYKDEYKTPYTGTVNLFGSGILTGAKNSMENYFQYETTVNKETVTHKYSDNYPVMIANKCQVPPPERIIIRNTDINIVLPDKEQYAWFANTQISVNEETECTHHIDIGGDLICDDCGEVFTLCTEHSDINKDGYCTWCNKDVPIPCQGHTDRDRNGECDTCKTDYTCPGHVDEKKNHICDVCEAPLCHGEHFDSNGDGKCDICKENVN